MAFNRERALAAAAKYAARGQHDRAAREYQAIVEADPSDIRSWVMLADCLVRAGDTQGAIDRFHKVADFYAENDEPTKAIAVYRQILNLDASRLDIHVKIAELLQNIGRTADAIATYEFVAQSYFQAGKVAEGLEGFRMVAELDAGAVAKRLRVAELYSREGRKDEAVEHFRLAAQRLLAKNRYDDYIRVGERLLYHKDDDADILRSLAELYLVHAKEPRRALMKLNGLLRVVPNDPLGLELLADTFVALGKEDKAVSVAFELAKEQRKGDLQAKEGAARILKKALNWNPAKPDELRKLLTDVEAEVKVLRAGEPEVLIDVADDFEVEDDLDLDLDVEIEEGGDEFELDGEDEIGEDGYDVTMSDTDKVLLETRVYVRYKMFEHALVHVERLDALEPGNVDGIELRAEIYDRMGRLREAADLFVRLAQLVGESDPARAEQYLDQAVALEPEHPQATMMLSALEAVGRGGAARPRLAATKPDAAPAPERTPAPAKPVDSAPSKTPLPSAPASRSGMTPLPSLLPKREGKTPLPSLPPRREGKTPLPSLPPRREPTPPPGPPPVSEDSDSPVSTDDSGLLRFAAPKKRPPPPPGRGRRRTSDSRGRGRPGGDDDSSEGESEPSGATEQIEEVGEVEELDGVELLEVDELEAVEEVVADAAPPAENDGESAVEAAPEPAEGEAAQAEDDAETEPESAGEDDDAGSRRLPPLGFLPTRGRSTRSRRRRKDKESGLPKGLPSLPLRRGADADADDEATSDTEATELAAAPAEPEEATQIAAAEAESVEEATKIVAAPAEPDAEEATQLVAVPVEPEADAATQLVAAPAEPEAEEATQLVAAPEPEAEAEEATQLAEAPAQAEEAARIAEAEAEEATQVAEAPEAEAEEATQVAEAPAEEVVEASDGDGTPEEVTPTEGEADAEEATRVVAAGDVAVAEPELTETQEVEAQASEPEASQAAVTEAVDSPGAAEAETGEAAAEAEAVEVEVTEAADAPATDAPEGAQAAEEPEEPVTSAPAADEPDISEELDELEFFISQGFDDDAAVAYMELVGRYPGHSALDPYTERFAASLETPAEEAAAPVLLDDEAALPESSGDSGESFEAPLFDFGENDEEDDFLSSIFDDEAPTVRKTKPAEPPRARAELEGQVDARTLFDLGTAYREMGLIDDALTQFRMASKDAEWKAKSLVMMASLHLHRGEIPLAIADLEEAVAFAVTDTEASEARYELGVIYQVMGEHAKAIAAFEQVHAGYRDRDERLVALLES